MWTATSSVGPYLSEMDTSLVAGSWNFEVHWHRPLRTGNRIFGRQLNIDSPGFSSGLFMRNRPHWRKHSEP
jgi:hypothetical protein